MYVLEFLKNFPNEPKERLVKFEYRFLCSGELYNSSVQTSDWRKSTASRILCNDPINLLVVSQPFDEFPQELALRFSAPQVSETYGNSTSTFYPDDEIAKDIAAILTVLFRRLVTVAVKTREIHPPQGSIESIDWPNAIFKSLTPTHWQHKPLLLGYRHNNQVEINDYNPAPLGIDFNKLKKTLLGLPAMPTAEQLVLSARLYSLALAQIHDNFNIAYQLLISTVETIAGSAYKNFRPTDDEILASRQSFVGLAKKFRLSTQEANQLAIEANKDNPWTSRKFQKFLLDNCTDELWEEDTVFRTPANFLPSKQEFGTSLKQIYNARSKLTHSGKSFPEASVLGMNSTVPVKAFMSFDWTKKPFPLIAWFERVVNNALNGFIKNSI